MTKKRKMDPAGKRERVMSVGERLFADQGYTNTTMNDIARAAEVAVGTVYRLFPDKPSLLAALHSRMEDRFIEAMERGWQRADAFEDKFGAMIVDLFDAAEVVREIMPLYAMTKDVVGAADYRPGARMVERIAELYRSGVRKGAYRSIPADIQSHVAHAMVDGAMRAWMMQPTPARRRKISQELDEMMRRAFLVNA